MFLLPIQSGVLVVKTVEVSSRISTDGGMVRLDLSQNPDRWDISWRDGTKLLDLKPDVRLADGKPVTYASGWEPTKFVRVSNQFGKGVEYVRTRKVNGALSVIQRLWSYPGRPEVFVQVSLQSNKGDVSSRYLAPIAGRYVKPHRGPLQSLYVPFDNDMYSRYSSSFGSAEDPASHEVGAVYDDVSRKGLVVGSIDHDVWKSGVRFTADGKVLAYAGEASKDTRDQLPHGLVTGKTISSPRFVIGEYSDWRDGMEQFGDLNAMVRPKLAWPDGVPFGWNSWSGYKNKVTASDAEAATAFIHDKLPDYRSGGTAYINLDSFWDNLSVAQRAAFVTRAHSLGLKAGIYYTPFVAWGDLRDKVGGAPQLTYRDLALKGPDGNPLAKLSGGYPLDPTHPGTIDRMRRQLAEFSALGFDFVKFDFMSHGSLEGAHYLKSIQTGVEAYAYGMRQLDEMLSKRSTGSSVFISLSIAPLFPQGFGHSRRISCDAFANIGSTEYMLNSATYGWWTNHRLYEFNDPDSACVFQPKGEPPSTPDEARSRMTASVIAGGMLVESDALNDPAAEARVLSLFTNPEVVALSRRALAFRPVNGDTGNKAGALFEWIEPGGKTAYVAAFNYDKKAAASLSVSLDRLGLKAGRWKSHDLWSGANGVSQGTVKFSLGARQCILIRLTR
jgi:hypothetical protein